MFSSSECLSPTARVWNKCSSAVALTASERRRLGFWVEKMGLWDKGILKLTAPGKHLWLQQLTQHCNRSHTAAKCLLWVIILFTCLVAASGGIEQNAFQTADKALSVVPFSEKRTATSEKMSRAVLLLFDRARLKRVLSPFSKACLCLSAGAFASHQCSPRTRL